MASVSIVVSAYNYAAYIGFALDSLLKQTYEDFEVLIVDDGSTDNTSEVVRPYLDDERFSYHFKENGGQASAKNHGIHLAQREYIAFLDADDIWEADKLEKQLPLFEDASVGVVFSGRSYIDKDNVLTPFFDIRLKRGWVLDDLFVDNFVCFSSSIVRQSVFEKIGCFDEELAMGIDYELWMRVATQYKFDYVDLPLVQYRVGHGNMSQNVAKRIAHAWKIMRRVMEVPDICQKLSPEAVDRAFAMTHCSEAKVQFKSGEYANSFIAFIKSLKHEPFRVETWKSFVKFFVFFNLIRTE